MPVGAETRYLIPPDLVVAKDGSGHFTSVHAALQSIPKDNRETAGPHAFAVLGRADRTVIQNADVLSLGADTLSLWRQGKTAADTALPQA